MSSSKAKSHKTSLVESSSSVSSKTPDIKLISEPDFDSEFKFNEDPEEIKNNLDRIKNIIETQIENSNHLENVLPSKYLKNDPSCIRKYSNFSFPKEYKYFYDFVDYFPSKKVCKEHNIRSTRKLQEYLQGIQNETSYADFLDTLKLVAPKALTLIDKIQDLDAKDMAQYGKKFKHFIFSDSKSSMGGVKFLASALIASGMNLGYTAEPKLGKKNWNKMKLLSNEQLERTKYNNFYIYC